jgi:hypothetical protein
LQRRFAELSAMLRNSNGAASDGLGAGVPSHALLHYLTVLAFDGSMMTGPKQLCSPAGMHNLRAGVMSSSEVSTESLLSWHHHS